MIQVLVQDAAQIAPAERASVEALWARTAWAEPTAELPTVERVTLDAAAEAASFDAPEPAAVRERVFYIVLRDDARPDARDEDQNELVGACCWIERTMLINDTPQRIVGLGGVAVEPARQGEGHGVTLLETGIAEIRRHGYDWAVLFCGRHRRTFYERFGFRLLEGEILKTEDGVEMPINSTDMLMALPLNETVASDFARWQTARIHVGDGQW